MSANATISAESLALEQILKALEGLTNSSAQNVLKMVAGRYNARVISNFAPMVPVTSANPQRGKRGGAGSGYRNQSSRPRKENLQPEVRVLKERLSLVQEKIRTSSVEYPGGFLPKDHDLIKERDNLLANIVQKKSSFRNSTNFDGSPPISQSESGENGSTSSQTTSTPTLSKA